MPLSLDQQYKYKKELNTTQVDALSYRSQSKHKKRHNPFLKYDEEKLLDQSCFCTAG